MFDAMVALTVSFWLGLHGCGFHPIIYSGFVSAMCMRCSWYKSDSRIRLPSNVLCEIHGENWTFGAIILAERSSFISYLNALNGVSLVGAAVGVHNYIVQLCLLLD